MIGGLFFDWNQRCKEEEVANSLAQLLRMAHGRVETGTNHGGRSQEVSTIRHEDVHERHAVKMEDFADVVNAAIQQLRCSQVAERSNIQF